MPARPTVAEQVARGALVCPVTHSPLRHDGDALVSAAGARYPVVGEVPLLLRDSAAAQRYVDQSERMRAEYDAVSTGAIAVPGRPARRAGVLGALRARVSRAGEDYRTSASVAAFERLVTDAPDDALLLAVGGGPVRAHERLVDVNIGPFVEVDVVGDAHELPYADGSVDGIHVEAVLEHLADPQRAVEEMARVLRPGATVLAITPFLQAFHGYPNHFHGFTLAGHRQLFERAGLQVLDAGTCVGPFFAVADLGEGLLRRYAPGPLGRLLILGWSVIARVMRPLDRRLDAHGPSHELASTTYVVARKE